MMFLIRPFDGSSGRLADRISFLSDAGIVAWASTGNRGFQFSEADLASMPERDLTAAAEHVARLLHRYRDHSLVVNPTSSGIARGDEAKSADVYPPGHQPRVILQG